MIESEIIVQEMNWADEPDVLGAALTHFLIQMKKQQIAVQSVHIEVDKPTKAKVIPWGIGQGD